ncbi:MFS transporter [Rummeliibacillus sp. JY-2-4R]
MENRQTKAKITPRGWLVIVLLFFLTIISNADKAIIGFASVPIMKELGLQPEQWGIVGSVFFLLYSISAVVVGGIADKIGTKKVIIWMALIWALVQFSTIFVSSFAILLVTRIILGAGEGPSYSLAMTAASKWLPKEKLGFGLTFVSIGGPVGVAVSAPILLHLITNFGWRSAFIATGIIGVVWTIIWILFAREQPEKTEEQVAIEIEKEETQVFQSFKSFLFSKNFLFIALCGFGTYWSFTVGLNWLPNYLENVRHLNAQTLSFVVSLPWILIACSQLFFSTVSDRLYAKTRNFVKSRVFILGPILMLAGVFYYIGTLMTSNVLAIAFLSLGLSLGCLTLVLGPAILVEFVAKKDHGKVQGWFMAITSLGGIAGPYITGRLVQQASELSDGFHLAFRVCGIILALIGFFAVVGVRPKKQLAAENTTINETVIEQ